MLDLGGVKRHDVDAFGTRIHVAEIGDGPLVLLVHGFPESWYSWRHQLVALADAGYRAVAIDVRGYGSSEVPTEVDAYRIVHLVGDCVGVVQALGESAATIVGHDWGSPIAAAAALFRPDIFLAVGLLSVAYEPRNSHRPTEVFRTVGGEEEFYIEYFQEPGRAEAEIAEDPGRWLEGFYYSASGDTPQASESARTMAWVAPGARLSDRFSYPLVPLSWLSEDDLAFYIEEFRRSGFTGGLNRYRCLDSDWFDLRSFHGVPIHQPSFFIGGERDGPTLFGKGSISRYPQTLPNLRSLTILPKVGHWIQQEDPVGVNRVLLSFLQTVPQCS